MEVKQPSLCSEDLTRFRADIECRTRSLNSLKGTLEEIIVIILRQKLPMAVLDKVRPYALDEFN